MSNKTIETRQYTEQKTTEKKGSSLVGKVLKGVVVVTAFAAGAATGLS